MADRLTLERIDRGAWSSKLLAPITTQRSIASRTVAGQEHGLCCSRPEPFKHFLSVLIALRSDFSELQLATYRKCSCPDSTANESFALASFVHEVTLYLQGSCRGGDSEH